MRQPIITLDGPAAAGKSTAARLVADRLGFRFLDTGAMYRAVAWKALHEGVDVRDEAAVTAVGERASFDLEGGRVMVDGHDVARAIRTPEIDAGAAAVARHPRVREVLVRRQRQMGEGGGIVMEGRDIGTVVFPDAPVKIYLTASPEERARRRASDPAHAASQTAVLAEIATALAERDKSDSTRAVSPLAQASDALAIDTTSMPIDRVVEEILALVDRHRNAIR